MSDTVRLVALHGFLGSPADWDPLRECFPGEALVALDAWHLIEGLATATWPAVGAALAARLREVRAASPRLPHYLVAYSFGGRLSLAAGTALQGPGCPVDGAVFVSAHPGLADTDRAARNARRAADAEWARLFETTELSRIWAAWNAQPVLAGARRPGDDAGLPASREVLARAMRAYTLAGQPDFRAALREWPTPWLWVSGARDTKFAAVADGLRRDGMPGAFVECPDAGHRVPWDNPQGFSAIVRGWIGGLTPRDGGQR